MKELSIEEKAKAYDEAIKRARKLYEQGTITESLCYVFPELKESEDEKIKKRIIALVNAYGQGMYKDEMLAWLEKQDKQEPFNYENINIQQKDFAPKSALEAINEKKVDNANKVDPRQEKLTEFEKAVKQVMEEAIECGDTHNLKADAEMLLSLVHKSAWSEEDEKIRKALICGMYTIKEQHKTCFASIPIDNVIAWLEKQCSEPNWCHHKVDLSDCSEEYRKAYYDGWNNCNQQYSQLKAEQTSSWSEEDEAMWTEISDLLWEGYKQSGSKFSWDDIRNWVNTKLLKDRVQPQITWKPSDEQMKQLGWVAEQNKNNMIGKELMTLYQDLKKLRKE